MRRLLIAGTVAALVLGAATVSVQAASSDRKVPSPQEVPTMERAPSSQDMARLEAMAGRLADIADQRLDALAGSVNCRDVACLNRELTKLSNFANATAKRLNKLDKFARQQLNAWDSWYEEWNTCVPVVPLTIYGSPTGPGGYLYTNDGSASFPTTALDVTWEGDPVSFYALEWTCQVT
jgi:hypothetical protein